CASQGGAPAPIRGIRTHLRKLMFASLFLLRRMLNVALHSQVEDPSLPDDVEYTRAVLREVAQGRRLPIDLADVRCVGFSRGARFCSRLASQLSSFLAGVAAVGGVRFPEPNNATRPMPIIAFHGTDDPVNPIRGSGDPSYWHSSVDAAVRRWARFNGCEESSRSQAAGVVTISHTKCADGADVRLLRMAGAGHTWPGSHFGYDKEAGSTSLAIDANQVMYRFFADHPRPRGECGKPLPGSDCYQHVKQAMDEAILTHPDRYPGLTPRSSFEDVQLLCRQFFYADCPEPCGHRANDSATHPIVQKPKPPGSSRVPMARRERHLHELLWTGEVWQWQWAVFGLAPLFVLGGCIAGARRTAGAGSLVADASEELCAGTEADVGLLSSSN
ncbi:unnamed protein product, partial [Prorocentrum cordatum]